MGLNKSADAVYLSINKDGKLTRQVKQPTADSVERTSDKNGKTYHEEFYSSVDGLIVDIATKEKSFNGAPPEKFWLITLQDGKEKIVLQFKYNGGYATTFFKTLPNVDPNTPVVLAPKLSKDDKTGKPRSTLFVMQNGNPLKHYYTKDNPNGLPQANKVRFQGKEVWDFTDQTEFFEKYVKEVFLPKVKNRSSKIEDLEVIEVDAEEVKEDLPF